jgi:hypothetical protein
MAMKTTEIVANQATLIHWEDIQDVHSSVRYEFEAI